MTSYSYLVTDLIQATENNGTEFLAYTPKMINKAEERLTRDLDDYGLQATTSVAVSSNTAAVTLPTGTRIIKNFNVISDSSRINLLLRTDEYLNDYWPVSASVGTPTYYARTGDATVKVAPTPTSTLNGEIVHISRPTTLSSVSETNYFTNRCYDVLFNASMVEALIFMKNWSIVPMYESRYKEGVASLRNQARRTRRDDMQAPRSPQGADNNITKGEN